MVQIGMISCCEIKFEQIYDSFVSDLSETNKCYSDKLCKIYHEENRN